MTIPYCGPYGIVLTQTGILPEKPENAVGQTSSQTSSFRLGRCNMNVSFIIQLDLAVLQKPQLLATFGGVVC